MEKDPRYPYTYAADFIRMIPQWTADGVKLSRSEASQIRQAIAKVLNMDDESLAIKLAEAYRGQGEEEDEMRKQSIEAFIHLQKWENK